MKLYCKKWMRQLIELTFLSGRITNVCYSLIAFWENFMQHPPLSLTLMLGFTCLGLALVLGILILGFVLSFQNRKKDEKEKKK